MERFKWPTPLDIKPNLEELLKLQTLTRKRSKVTSSAQLSLFELFTEHPAKDPDTIEQKPTFNDYFIFSDIRNGESTFHSWELAKLPKKERILCEKFAC